MALTRNRDEGDEGDEDAAASAPLLGVHESQQLLSPDVAASPFPESGDTAHKRLWKGFRAYSVAGEVRRPLQTGSPVLTPKC